MVPPSGSTASLDPENIAGEDHLSFSGEVTLLKHAEQLVGALYARQRQLQENNAVVAGLLSADNTAVRRER